MNVFVTLGKVYIHSSIVIQGQEYSTRRRLRQFSAIIEIPIYTQQAYACMQNSQFYDFTCFSLNFFKSSDQPQAFKTCIDKNVCCVLSSRKVLYVGVVFKFFIHFANANILFQLTRILKETIYKYHAEESEQFNYEFGVNFCRVGLTIAQCEFACVQLHALFGCLITQL